MSEPTTPQPLNGAEAAAAAAASAMRSGNVDPMAGATVVAHPGAAGHPVTGDGSGATIHQLPGATAGWVPTPRRRLGDIVVDAMWVPRTVVEQMGEEARQLGRRSASSCSIAACSPASSSGRPSPSASACRSSRSADRGGARRSHADRRQTARRLRALPIAFDDETLVVAMVDPGNIVALDDIAMLTGQRVRPIVVADEELDLVIQRVLGVDSEVGAALEQIDEVAALQDEPSDLRETTDDEGPTVKIVQSILAQAVERHASDVHFDPTPEGMKVRFRIDGVVHEVTSVPRALPQASSRA